MKPFIKILVVASIGLLALWGCGSKPATKTISIDGPCDECPLKRHDSVLKSMQTQGLITKYKLESKDNTIILEFDSGKVETNKVFSYLRTAGYNVGEDLALGSDYDDRCCKIDASEMVDNERSADIEDDQTADEFVETALSEYDANTADLEAETQTKPEASSVAEELNDAMDEKTAMEDLNQPSPGGKKK